MLYVKKLSSNAMLPEHKKDDNVSYDLFSAENVTIPSNGKARINTDLAIQVPNGTYGRIVDRASFAFERHIHVVAGVLSRDYKDNVFIMMFNHSDQPVTILVRMRIAQLIIEKYQTPKIQLVQELPNNKHGSEENLAFKEVGITEYTSTC